MLSGSSTRIASQYHQVKAGGDTAAMIGIAKALFAIDEGGQPAAAMALTASWTKQKQW